MVHPIDPTELPQHRWTRERLSAYIDHDLPASERDEVEAHLSVCESCAREADTLRQTVTWLQQLPSRAAPRSFVLSASPTLAARRLAWLFPYFSAAGALATILLIVVLTADWLQMSGAVRLASAPASRLVGLGAAPPSGNTLRLPDSNAAPRAEPAAPQATLPEKRGRLDQALGAAAVPTAVPRLPTPSQDKVEAQADKTAETAASTPLPQPADGSPAAGLSAVTAPAAAAGARAAPVAPLARKPTKGIEGEQAKDATGPAGAPAAPLLAPAAPQIAAPTELAAPLEFAASAPLSATATVTPTTSPTISPTLSRQSVLPALTPTMASAAPVSSPVPAGAAPARSPASWVWRLLEVGLLLTAAGSLTGAWWVRQRH